MLNSKEKIRSLIINEVYVDSASTLIINDNGLPSPWMFDFKKVLLRGEFLTSVVDLFLDKYSKQYPFQVGGLEVGAIPIIAAITQEAARRGLSINGFFIRKSRKKTGTMNMVEGCINQLPIILVDDLIHSGKSFLQQVLLLEELKANELAIGKVTDVFTILSLKSVEDFSVFHAKEIKIHTLFKLADLAEDLGLKNIANTTSSNTKLVKWDLVWSRRGKGANLALVLPRSELLVNKDHVYFGDDTGNYYCLNKKTGAEIWRYFVPLGAKKAASFSSAVLSKNILVFGSRDGNVYALHAETGKRIWAYLEADWLLGSPAVFGDFVFIPLSFGLFKRQGKVVSLKIETGKKEWGYDLAAPISGGIKYSPADGSLIFGSEDGLIHALEAKTGKQNWLQKVQIKPRGFPAICEELNFLTVSGVIAEAEDQGRIYILDSNSGAIKSVFTDFQFSSYGTPCLNSTYIYFTALDKYLYKSDHQGQLIWKVSLEARCFSSPVAIEIGGLTYIAVGANNGYLYLIDSETGKIVDAIFHTERIINKVVYDEDEALLFVPTQAGDVYAYKLNFLG